MLNKFFAMTATALTVVAWSSGAQAQSYRVTGNIAHARIPADYTQLSDTGVSAIAIGLSQSHSSPDGLSAATFTALASANSLHAFVHVTSAASLLSHATASVTATATDSVTFNGGAGGLSRCSSRFI